MTVQEMIQNKGTAFLEKKKSHPNAEKQNQYLTPED